MTGKRSDLGLGDLSEFQPKPDPAQRPDAKAVAQAASDLGFVSRQAPAAPRRARGRRTGRNVQLNLKLRKETIEAFYQYCDTQGVGLGEGFEAALDLLLATNK